MGIMRLLPLALALCTAACASGPTLASPYARSSWGGWRDLDRDCQDARQEALIATSEVEPVFADARNCRVVEGRWRDPYTGTVVTNPSKLDVDHVIALKDAHVSGGFAWTRDERRAFANDPGNLIPVTASANRSKGSRGPADWLPPLSSYRCEYIEAHVALKARYGLVSTAREQGIVDYMLKICALGEAPTAPQ